MIESAEVFLWGSRIGSVIRHEDRQCVADVKCRGLSLYLQYFCHCTGRMNVIQC